jgi:hypothetical protein
VEQDMSTVNIELTNLWQVLVLTYVDSNSPVWYDFHTLEPFKTFPEGRLEFVDVQLMDFDKMLSYTLLLGLASSKGKLILSLDLYSFSAQTLLEPLALLADNFLDLYFVFRHEFVELGGNTLIRFKVQCGKALLNAPLSSLGGWRRICHHRLKQVQAKLRNYTPLELEYELDEE